MNPIIYEQILNEISEERCRQESLKAAGKFLWTCADMYQGPNENVRKLAVLAEEFGEVAKEVTEQMIRVDKGENGELYLRHNSKIRRELIQVATVCIAWAESL